MGVLARQTRLLLEQPLVLCLPGSEGEGTPPACPVSPMGGREGENKEGLNVTSSSGLNWCGGDLRVAGLAMRERLLSHVLPSPPDTARQWEMCSRGCICCALRAGPGCSAGVFHLC